MTTEHEAVARAQAEANRKGKPHVVLHSDQYGFEVVTAEWWISYREETPGTSFREVQRIDPAPAPSEPPCGTCGGAPASSLPCICGGAGTQAAEVQGMREELLRLAAAPPAPLARDMTMRQYLAAHAPVAQLAAAVKPGENLAEAIWAYADAVLAAEGRP